MTRMDVFPVGVAWIMPRIPSQTDVTFDSPHASPIYTVIYPHNIFHTVKIIFTICSLIRTFSLQLYVFRGALLLFPFSVSCYFSLGIPIFI